ncbi:MAG: hypothetical protein MMC33_009860 [Icmadophila ericetorum]|nr:hypothetical protein [Icmadophila ericetorum]
MQPPTPAAESMKEQVVDSVPKRIKELKFGILSKQDIANQAVLEVCDRELYDIERNRIPVKNGPLDGRMGISNKAGFCETCEQPLQQCNGHFGYVRLALPVFHVGYFKMIITILQEICKDCSKVLLSEPERRAFLRDLRRPNIDNLRKTQICKKILDQCKKNKKCFSCGALNGVVKKAGQHPLKIIHDRFRAFNTSSAIKKTPPQEKILFDKSFDEAKKSNHEIDRHFKKAMDDMNPLRVLNLFRRISASDCELLGMHPGEGRPEMFLWQFVPAPPVCIRPSVAQDSASTEDDLTQKLSDIVYISHLIKEGLSKGQPVSTIMEQWDFLQLQVAMYINSDTPGLQAPGFNKTMRGFCQRLKGKQGRFRGNLSGKRVDFSGRTVISPDPNLGVDQVAIPELVAKNLTYPEKVSRYNKTKLQERVRNGPKTWPGANYIWKKDQEIKQFLKYGKLSLHAQNLQEGDIVERHLEDGDIVLFNRQPSLHKLSILSHYVKVRPHRTFRLNECVCNPYNADFDGDEMNLHVPQTEEARAEAIELMGVKHNLCTPKNGEPIISAIQDFITAAYLLSSKDKFYDRKTFTNICMHMVDGNVRIDLPPPAIFKPVMLWTGKQVFNVMMRPNKATKVLINLDAPCKEFKPKAGTSNDLIEDDTWLVIRNSEVMCGVMDKSTIGSGKKESVFYVTLRDYGPDAAVASMNRLAKLAARWLTQQGFSIGIDDVYPGDKLVELKKQLIEDAYKKCDELITKFKAGELKRSAGCDEEQTMENQISGILSGVRAEAGSHCIAELSKNNAPLTMAKSGSKGSAINVSQMVAVVGQQIIGGKRVADGFQDRSLPHFPKNARQPPSKGFVANSFFSGLTPTEFLFHAISGREGLVDTAVKTAETGYMSRRLMKSLEDLSSQYDDTVRNSSSNVIQFQYGEDKLDPLNMEGKAKPVHFQRTFTHAEATTWNNKEKGLLPLEIIAMCKDLLSKEEDKLKKYSQSGESLDWSDDRDNAVDQNESARGFLRDIEQFIGAKVKAHEKRRDFWISLPPTGANEKPAKRKKATAVLTHAESVGEALEQTNKLTRTTLTAFVEACLVKYKKAQVEPGHAVGAVGAQSIGEPGTQMTLKTFHFAGVAGMSITQGVPRIKEIINASKTISTPVITCELASPKVEIAARIVKGRIEKTYVKDVIQYLEDLGTPDAYVIALKVDTDTIDKLQLEITTADIVSAILSFKKLKIDRKNIHIYKDAIHISIPISPEEILAKPLRKVVKKAVKKGSRTSKSASKTSSKKISKKGTKKVSKTSKKISKKASTKTSKKTSKTASKKISTKTAVGPSKTLSTSLFKPASSKEPPNAYSRIQAIKRMLPDIVITGYPLATRAIIQTKDDKSKDVKKKDEKKDDEKLDDEKNDGQKKDDKPQDEEQKSDQEKEETVNDVEMDGGKMKNDKPEKHHTLLVEGYGLRQCMTTVGVHPYTTRTNSVMEMREVLGIEAARKTIIDEIELVMQSMEIDPRHMQLLADVMTYKGEVLGITRFGLSKMRDSVLQLASFEKTPDHLFEAAWHMKADKIEGVSECIIMGQSMSVGTGSFQVVRKLGIQNWELGRKPTVFEDTWNELEREKRKALRGD